MPSTSSLQRRVVPRIVVRPPERASSGAQAINAMLGANSKLSRRLPILPQYKTVINWGNSNPIPARENLRVINRPEGIRTAVNKLSALLAMQAAGVPIPDFQEVPPDRTGDIWLARSVLIGSSGVGITVVREGEEFPRVPLYTKYIKKLEELRIHVAFGKPIFLQYKKRLSDNEQTADQKLIRNHDNGWVFCPRELDSVDDVYKQAAVSAVVSLGLDIGAVDIVIGKKDKKPYVLEVNSAPGITSPTLTEAYKQALTQELL